MSRNHFDYENVDDIIDDILNGTSDNETKHCKSDNNGHHKRRGNPKSYESSSDAYTLKEVASSLDTRNRRRRAGVEQDRKHKRQSNKHRDSTEIDGSQDTLTEFKYDSGKGYLKETNVSGEESHPTDDTIHKSRKKKSSIKKYKETMHKKTPEPEDTHVHNMIIGQNHASDDEGFVYSNHRKVHSTTTSESKRAISGSYKKDISSGIYSSVEPTIDPRNTVNNESEPKMARRKKNNKEKGSDRKLIDAFDTNQDENTENSYKTKKALLKSIDVYEHHETRHMSYNKVSRNIKMSQKIDEESDITHKTQSVGYISQSDIDQEKTIVKKKKKSRKHKSYIEKVNDESAPSQSHIFSSRGEITKIKDKGNEELLLSKTEKYISDVEEQIVYPTHDVLLSLPLQTSNSDLKQKHKKSKRKTKHVPTEDSAADIVEYTPVIRLTTISSDSSHDEDKTDLVLETMKSEANPPVHLIHDWIHPDPELSLSSSEDEIIAPVHKPPPTPAGGSKRKAPSLFTQQDTGATQSADQMSLGASSEGDCMQKDFEDKMSDIFGIQGSSYDVYLKAQGLSWLCVSKANKVPDVRKKKVRERIGSGLIRHGSTASLDMCEVEDLNSLTFTEIIGIQIKFKSKTDSTKYENDNDEETDEKALNEDLSHGKRPEGFILYFYDSKEGSRLKCRTLIFEHPSLVVVKKWISAVRNKLKEFPDRPKSIKIFLQPHAGKHSKLIYNHKILPLFNAARINIDMEEISYDEYVRKAFAHIELYRYDSIVAVGGDGTVSRVANALLNKYQTKMTPHSQPVRPALAIGIIPTGKTNQICHSVMGTEDPVTAAVHIIVGHRICVDVCAIFQDDEVNQFEGWAFSGHYGFFGEALRLIKQTKLLGEMKEDAAILAALKMSNFRTFGCEVQYLPHEDVSSNPNDGHTCYQECKVCGRSHTTSGGSVSDYVESLTDSVIDGHSKLTDCDERWQLMKGEFTSTSLFALPCRDKYAPLGMSMYTHLADGTMDLVVVKKPLRKDFVRFLKRHGNKKNQFSFPFIEVHRCTEVKVHIRSNQTWQHKDYAFNELEDRVKQDKRVNTDSSKNIKVIGHLESSSSSDSDDDPVQDSKNDLKKVSDDERTRKHSSRVVVMSSEDDDSNDHGDDNKKNRRVSKSSMSIGNLFQVTGASEGTYHKPTDYIALEAERRNKKKQKKDEKKRKKDEEKSKSMWNRDMEKYPCMNLHFRVHQGLVVFHARGIPKAYIPKDVSLNCLSMIR